jgi:hypothetical protein
MRPLLVVFAQLQARLGGWVVGVAMPQVDPLVVMRRDLRQTAAPSVLREC